VAVVDELWDEPRAYRTARADDEDSHDLSSRLVGPMPGLTVCVPFKPPGVRTGRGVGFY
jgi:hypothetical protein